MSNLEKLKSLAKDLLGKLLTLLAYLLRNLVSLLKYLLETPPKDLLTKKNLIILAVVLVVGFVVFHPRENKTISSAETRLQESVKAVDTKSFDAAMDVAKLFDLKERLKAPVRGESMMAMSMFERENQGKTETIRKVLDETADKIAASYEEGAQKNKAVFFAQNFTVEELAELKEFYESSVGQKLIKISDKMLQNDSMYIHELVMSKNQEIRAKMMEEMKSSGLKAPKPPEENKGASMAPMGLMPPVAPMPLPAPPVAPKVSEGAKSGVKAAPSAVAPKAVAPIVVAPKAVAPKAPETKK
jgi:hypothetical protein